MKSGITKILWRIFYFAYLLFFICMYFTITAYAYVDPATTAMITQIVAGIFISAGVAFGVFRRKIILFFKNISVKRMKRKIEKENVKDSNSKNGNS